MINSLHLVYQNLTHTERYIPFSSHHHQKTITGVLRVMRGCVNCICDHSTKPEELQRGLSVKLERILAPSHLDICPYPVCILKRTLMEVKHISKRQVERGCVRDTLNSCDHVYTGESKRILKPYMEEHRWALQRVTPYNGHFRSTRWLLNSVPPIYT